MKANFIEYDGIEWKDIQVGSFFSNLINFVNSTLEKLDKNEKENDGSVVSSVSSKPKEQESNEQLSSDVEQGTNPSSSEQEASDNTVIFAFAKMKDLHEGNCLNKLIEQQRDFDIVKEKRKGRYAPFPIVTIALEELNDVLVAKLGKDEDDEIKIQLEIVKSLNLDKRVDFLDSSIWHYFIALNNDFEKNLVDVIKKINKNYELKLYQTNVAKEFIEFQRRIFINSYLANVGEHASAVTPFKFHSEQGMSTKAGELRKNLNGFKWRILLVDDYAEKSLKINSEEVGETKKKILVEMLNSQDNNSHTKDSIIYELETSPSIDDFKEKLQNNKEPKSSKIYDIILLDYLLGDKKGGKNNEREYSTEILKWIKGNNGELDKDLQGPLGKFWFFSISAFPYAFIEKIRQMGYSLNDEDWTIFRGADPINMPELFKYNLFELMKHQIDKVLSLPNIFVNLNRDDDFLEKLLYLNWSTSSNKVKVEYYQKFLMSWGNLSKLLNDKNHSLFASKFLQNIGFSDEQDVFGHLHALINFLVFEPSLKWSKMWEEYVIVKNKFPNCEKLKGIRDYILEQRELANG